MDNIKLDRIAEKCRKWDIELIRSKFGDVPDDFIPCWIADMDFKAPKPIEDNFTKVIQRGFYGYTYCYDEFFNAVINWQRKRHSIYVERDEINLCYGTVSTLHYTIQAFTNKDDYIIINTPVYNPFYDCAKKQGRKVLLNSFKIINNRYYIDFENLEIQFKKYKPKLMLFCTPHNPSGRVWSLEEINKLCKLCIENGVILVADEVHSEQIHIGKFTSIYAVKEDLYQNTVLLTSHNKAFNLGGLKTSYSIIKNKKLREIFNQRIFKNSITSPNIFGILGIITAYNECEYWLDEINIYIRENFKIFKKFIDNSNILTVMDMESSYLPWVNISKLNMDSEKCSEILATKYGVLIEAGSHFVKDGEQYIRINLGTQKENILELIKRLDAFLQEYIKK